MYLPGNRYHRKMSAQDLSEDVLEQQQCPVCMQYMLPHLHYVAPDTTSAVAANRKFRNVQPA